jgi:hypothetical protein
MIRHLISLFLERISNSIDSNNTILEMNGVVLFESSDKDFDFKSTVIKEVLEYCSEQGIKKVDKVVIASLYDADLHNLKRKHIFEQRTLSEAESKIVVVKEGKKTIAQVFFGEFVEITGDN